MLRVGEDAVNSGFVLVLVADFVSRPAEYEANVRYYARSARCVKIAGVEDYELAVDIVKIKHFAPQMSDTTC